MNEKETKLLEEVALFRHALLGDVLQLPPGHKGLYEKLKDESFSLRRSKYSLR